MPMRAEAFIDLAGIASGVGRLHRLQIRGARSARQRPEQSDDRLERQMLTSHGGLEMKKSVHASKVQVYGCLSRGNHSTLLVALTAGSVGIHYP